jgi:hypothetical protein
MFILKFVGAAVFGSTAIFGVALCVVPVAFIMFHSWRLVFRVVRHCALLLHLCFRIVHDVCIGFACCDARIVFFWWIYGFGVGMLPGRFPVWISRSCSVGLRTWQIPCCVFFVFVCRKSERR